MTVLNNLSKFVKANLYDDTYGGFYSSVAENKANLVTEDKVLLDMALAILAFSKGNDIDFLKKLLNDLRDFENQESGDYYEILDGTNIIQDIGRVKTFFTQLLVQYSQFRASIVLKDLELEKASRASVDRIIHFYLEHNNASIYSENWDYAIDSTKKLMDISLLIYVINKAELQKYYSPALSLLEQFIDGKRGAYSELESDNSPKIVASKKLSAMSLMLLALNTLPHDLKIDYVDYSETIKDTLNFISEHFRHPLTGGFWDKSDIDGKVSVDSVSSYYTNSESPFPIKSMTSHALLLLALQSISDTVNDEQISSMKAEAKEQLLHYYDEKNGGLNLGQGNWFSTPVNPTVPIARRVMVPPHTKGAFYVGNTAYLPLHEKITTLQLLGLLVFDETDEKRQKPIEKKDYELSTFSRNMDYITSGVLTDNYIDVEKYINWSKKTRSGFSYGLTAYRSPLGLKSDKTPQNFSALHVVADMTLLGEDIPDKEKLEISLVASQNEDGGFSEQPSLLSELFTTYCVVATEFILGRQNYDKEKCIEFVRSCQNQDGGFGNVSGYPSDTWHTNFGAVTLHLLGAEPVDKEALIQYLLSCQNENGGFGIIPNGVSEVFSTFRVIDSLTVLGVDIPNKEKTIDWLKSLQDKSGGFLYQEDKVVSFVGSYHAIGALYLLGELPKDVEGCQKWLSSHQSLDGGFSRAVGAPSDTTDEGFISIHASYMLEKKVNPYWIAIIT